MENVSSKRVLWTSFAVDFLDIGLNLAVSIITGSVVAIAETLQGITDLLTSGSLLIGYNASKRRANAKHPFGMGKEIYFWSLISAFLMLGATGFLSLYFGFKRLFNPQEISNVYLVVIVLAIAVISNGYAFTLSLKRLKKNIGANNFWKSFFASPLIEIKTAAVLDLMGTVASALGLVNITIYYLTGKPQFDAIGAIAVGLIVIPFSLFIIQEIRTFITGRVTDRKTLNTIRDTVLSFSEVKEVDDLKTMFLGSERLSINLDIVVDDNMKAGAVVDLIEQIKRKVNTQLNEVYYIQIELCD